MTSVTLADALKHRKDLEQSLLSAIIEFEKKTNFELTVSKIDIERDPAGLLAVRVMTTLTKFQKENR